MGGEKGVEGQRRGSLGASCPLMEKAEGRQGKATRGVDAGLSTVWFGSSPTLTMRGWPDREKGPEYFLLHGPILNVVLDQIEMLIRRDRIAVTDASSS